MRVNLPCLMGSCPNFLRPTCSYTEYLPSFLTGSCPMEWTTASYSSCLSFDSYWPYDSARCGFPRTLTLHLSTSHFVMIHVPWIWANRFLSRTLLNFRSFWTSAGFWNTALLYTSYAARLSCLDSRRISFNIFRGSYLIPFFKIVKIILRSLQAIAINDCIFFSGFCSLVV